MDGKVKVKMQNTYLFSDEVPVLVAVHLPVKLEHAVPSSSAHEVEVTLAAGQTAAHCCS